MKKGQIVLVVASLIAIFFLYNLRQTSLTLNDNSSPAILDQSNDFLENNSLLIAAGKDSLSPDQKSQIESAEKSLADDASIEHYDQLANLWANFGNFRLGGFYKQSKADQTGTAKDYADAATTFLLGLGTERDSLNRLTLYKEAIRNFEQASTVDSTNVDYKINLALCYVEGTQMPMRGVSALLELAKEHPDNFRVFLELGRLSIMSGQYPKAIERLERSLQLKPANAEAIFFLAEAYSGIGEKERAISLFLQCRKLVNNPAFQNEIDNYIRKLKNI